MDSKVVVTYKRKRLFSRRDSDAPSETSESKITKKFDNHEESTAEYVLQNKDREFGICHEYSEGNVGENALQCEHCDSQCSEQDVTKLQCLFSICTTQQDSPVSDQNEKDIPKQIKPSSKSDAKEIAYHSNVLSDGSNGEISNAEEKSADPQPKLLFAKSSSEYKDKCKGTFSISSPPSTLGTLSLEETNKINKDERSSSCNNLVRKRRLNSELITFSRRSKRNNDTAKRNISSEYVDTRVSETRPAASCTVDLQNEKKQLENIDNSCSFSAPPPETAMIVHVDKSLHTPQETAENTPADVAQPFNKDSQDEMLSSLQENVCRDVQNNHHIINVKPDNLSNDDVDAIRVPSDASGKRDSLLSLDLSISPHASRDIDCNRPLGGGYDENHPPGPSKILQDSPPKALKDKGKSVLESPLPLNNYIQLFPECRTDGLSLRSDNTNNGHAYSSFYGWPNLQLQQPREAYHEFLQTNTNRAQSFSRQNTMLDNVLIRARAMRGAPPTTWSEEELDCLWIGVRRHGKGNWDTIRMDRRLNFSLWKTPNDLADRWQEEQARLFSDRWQEEQARLFSYNNPISQVHCAGPTDYPSHHLTNPLLSQAKDEIRLSLGAARQYSYEGGSYRRPLLHPMMNMNTNDKQPQNHSTNSGGLSSSNGSQMKGNLPNWLREAVQIPSTGMRWLNQPNFQCSSEYSQQQQSLNNRATNVHAPVVSEKDDIIVITSDASSEETISDDLGNRP